MNTCTQLVKKNENDQNVQKTCSKSKQNKNVAVTGSLSKNK